MRCVLKCVAVAALVCIACASVDAEFEAWMAKYDKKYDSLEEKMFRQGVWKANVEKINSLNAEESLTEYGVNAFTDRTFEEMRRTHTSAQKFASFMKSVKMEEIVAPPANLSALPKSFSWVSKGAVTKIKDQGNCGSCWAFGAVATMEGQLFIHKKKLVNLSEQNVVDCDTKDSGCNGGDETGAFEYVIKNGGIMLDSDYPYKAKKGKCRFEKSKAIGGFKKWTYIKVKHEDDLRQYVYDHGPVSVGVHADEWFHYSGGVFDSKCQLLNDHAVNIVGWGQIDHGVPYWIIKNSWGTSWGIKGYMHLIRGKNKCGILEGVTQIHF